MDKTIKDSRGKVRYSTAYIGFTETIVDTGEVVAGKFKLMDGIDGQIICADKYVIVLLADGSKGTAKCHDEEFRFKKGLRIAFNRALIEHLKKETKKLYNS